MNVAPVYTNDQHGRRSHVKRGDPNMAQRAGGWDDSVQCQVQIAYHIPWKLGNVMTDQQFVYLFEMLQFLHRYTEVAPTNGMGVVFP